MLNLKNLGRAVVAMFLGAGMFVAAGISPAAAGIGPPGPSGGLIHSEGGFDFTLFDDGDGTTPFFVGEPFAPISGGDGGVLGICPGCFDDTPNILSITRSDGSLFSMTGLVGAAFGFGEEGPIDVPVVITPTDFPAGVDFAVFSDLDSEPLSSGVLTPGLFEFHPISTTFVSELFILSPLPFDEIEPDDCLCFDSMSFLVDFAEEDSLLQTQAIVPITVSFGASAVPEPAAFSVLGLGLVGLALMRRRRQALRA